MKFQIVILFTLGTQIILCARVEPILKQFQQTGDQGQYEYSYQSGIESKSEHRTPDGNTIGSYSYLDDKGEVKHVKYTAGVGGFQVLSSNVPVAGVAAEIQPQHRHVSAPGILDETPEVAAARMRHEAAHAAALRILPRIPQHAEPVRHSFPQAIPAINPNGILADTPEVAAAKTHHAAAHAEARRVLPQLPQQPDTFPSLHHAQPISHNRGFAQFAEEIPRSGLGETPEVAAAREAHLAYYAKVKANLPEENQSARFPF